MPKRNRPSSTPPPLPEQQPTPLAPAAAEQVAVAGAAATASSSGGGVEEAVPQVDKLAPEELRAGRVVSGWHRMLFSSSLATNTNKFYLLQLVATADGDGGAERYWFFSRFGRVGEAGCNNAQWPFDKLAEAKKLFEKKFRDKTGNTWAKAQGGKFVMRPGKYYPEDLCPGLIRYR